MRKTKVNFQGKDFEAELIDVNQAKELWNEYLLDDGSVLKLKVIVTEVAKLVDVQDKDGNPVYVVKSGNVLVVNSPESLKRK